MSVYQTGGVKCNMTFSLTPNAKKIIRGFLFAVAGGVVSIYAIEMGDIQASTIAIAFLISMLLVYGVDISKIEAGPITIWFETTEESDNQAEIDTDWNE